MTDIPCRCCGAATDQRVIWQPDLTTTGRAYGRSYEVGVCTDCVSLRPDEPGSAVRAALRLLGKDEGDWRLAADAFEEAGVDVSALLYVSKVRPKPQPKAWGHVTKDDRADLRRGYAKVLDFRVHAASGHDRPVPPHAPPDGVPPACLACGVGKAEQWHGPVRTKALTRGPEFIDGYVCPTCADALEVVGAVGPTFLERACLTAKGLSYSEGMQVPGLKAWITTGLPPGEPWAWVDINPPEPDLSPLQALQVQVADLQREVAELRAGVSA